MEAITNHINKNCLPKARTSAARPSVTSLPKADEITESHNYDLSETNENSNQPIEISTANPIDSATIASNTTATANATDTTTTNSIAAALTSTTHADTATAAAEGSKRRFGHPGVMIEYILISGVNDMPHIAHELGEALCDIYYAYCIAYIHYILYHILYVTLCVHRTLQYYTYIHIMTTYICVYRPPPDPT